MIVPGVDEWELPPAGDVTGAAAVVDFSRIKLSPGRSRSVRIPGLRAPASVPEPDAGDPFWAVRFRVNAMGAVEEGVPFPADSYFLTFAPRNATETS